MIEPLLTCIHEANDGGCLQLCTALLVKGKAWLSMIGDGKVISTVRCSLSYIYTCDEMITSAHHDSQCFLHVGVLGSNANHTCTPYRYINMLSVNICIDRIRENLQEMVGNSFGPVFFYSFL